jgi:hypothetical protein
MFRTFSIISGLIMLVMLTACNSGETLPDEPDWINNPGDGAVGSAVTHIKGRYYQEDLAIARARERLAARYGVEVSSVQTVKEKVVNDRAYVTSNKQIDQSVNKTTVKAQVRETWYDRVHDVMWVWLYPVE